MRDNETYWPFEQLFNAVQVLKDSVNNKGLLDVFGADSKCLVFYRDQTFSFSISDENSFILIEMDGKGQEIKRKTLIDHILKCSFSQDENALMYEIKLHKGETARGIIHLHSRIIDSKFN